MVRGDSTVKGKWVLLVSADVCDIFPIEMLEKVDMIKNIGNLENIGKISNKTQAHSSKQMNEHDAQGQYVTNDG